MTQEPLKMLGAEPEASARLSDEPLEVAPLPFPIGGARGVHNVQGGEEKLIGTVTLARGEVYELLNDSFVYFTDADDRLFVARLDASATTASLIQARSDAKGVFETPAIFPKGTVVFVNVLLSNNRRMRGVGVAGDPKKIRVGTDSTYVVEFFRDVAARRGLNLDTLLSDNKVRDTLLLEASRNFIGFEILKEPEPGDLVIGNATVLAQKFVAGSLSFDQASSERWRAVFPRLYALTTLAGNFLLKDQESFTPAKANSVSLHGPTGVATDQEGSVFIAERDSWHVKKVGGDGMITLVAGRLDGLDPTVAEATVSADGSSITDPKFRLGRVQDIKVDPVGNTGNLALTFRSGLLPFNFVGYICSKSGTYFGRPMVANNFYTLGAPDGREGFIDGPLGSARFRDPHGLSFDDLGNLYVCDRRHNRIRRIDATSGAVTTVLGDGWPFLTPPATGGSTWNRQAPDALSQATRSLVPLNSVMATDSSALLGVHDFGRLLNVSIAAAGSGLRASFSRPLQLAWRKVGETQELFVYDSYNSVIRKATVAYGKSFADAAITTVAGQETTYRHTETSVPFSMTIGKSGLVVDGADTIAQFDFARYDPASRLGFQIVHGGMALDTTREVLYVTDTNNQAVRAINLKTREVFTVARHDPRFTEGDSSRVLLSANLGGLGVLPDGSVVIADNANHVIRKLHLGFGL